MLELALLSGLTGLALFTLLGKSMRTKTEALPAADVQYRAELIKIRRLADDGYGDHRPRRTMADGDESAYSDAAMRALAINRALLAARAARGSARPMPSEPFAETPDTTTVRIVPMHSRGTTYVPPQRRSLEPGSNVAPKSDGSSPSWDMVLGRRMIEQRRSPEDTTNEL